MNFGPKLTVTRPCFEIEVASKKLRTNTNRIKIATSLLRPQSIKLLERIYTARVTRRQCLYIPIVDQKKKFLPLTTACDI